MSIVAIASALALGESALTIMPCHGMVERIVAHDAPSATLTNV
jgi:hypothetical protein